MGCAGWVEESECTLYFRECQKDRDSLSDERYVSMRLMEIRIELSTDENPWSFQ